jgi:hypothetical protein
MMDNLILLYNMAVRCMSIDPDPVIAPISFNSGRKLLLRFPLRPIGLIDAHECFREEIRESDFP